MEAAGDLSDGKESDTSDSDTIDTPVGKGVETIGIDA